MGYISNKRMGLAQMFFLCINGLRALCTQSYDEMNKKRGMQWESSSLATIVTGGKLYHVIDVGSKPVDLKHLNIGTSSPSLKLEMYKNPSMSGTKSVINIFNLLTSVLADTSLTKINTFSVITMTDPGTKVAADINILGPSTWSQSGVSPQAYASNRILEPNTRYLVLVTNTGASDGQVAIRYEFYEGDLDYPNTDYYAG